MKAKDIGEFGLIDELAKLLPPPPQLVVSMGDGAAVWCTSSQMQIGTTSTALQNVHFQKEKATWYETGWKAKAVNLSDIATMGNLTAYADNHWTVSR